MVNRDVYIADKRRKYIVFFVLYAGASLLTIFIWTISDFFNDDVHEE